MENYRFSPLFLVLLLRTAPSHQTERQPLYIGGLFDIDTSQGGWNSGAIIPAVKMAFDHINNMTGVLPGYRLVLLIKDAKVSLNIFFYFFRVECRSFKGKVYKIKNFQVAHRSRLTHNS